MLLYGGVDFALHCPNSLTQVHRQVSGRHYPTPMPMSITKGAFPLHSPPSHRVPGLPVVSVAVGVDLARDLLLRRLGSPRSLAPLLDEGGLDLPAALGGMSGCCCMGVGARGQG